MAKVSIIIPTYNEAKNIGFLASQIFWIAKQNNLDLELVIVDDNSPDGTGKLVEQLKMRYPITVVHRAGKLGLGSAVVAGFKAAKGEILGVMDADLSHPPEIVPELVKPLLNGDAELTIGSRYTNEGGIEEWPFIRRMISKGATMLARPLTKIKDPMSGLFFLKKEVIKGVKFKPKGYKIGLEIMVKGNYKNLKEVPYIFRNRLAGQSKLNMKEYLDYLKNVLNLLFYKIQKSF